MAPDRLRRNAPLKTRSVSISCLRLRFSMQVAFIVATAGMCDRAMIETGSTKEIMVTNFASKSTPSSGTSSAEIFTRPIGIILQFNADVINAFQSATVSWVQRRQEALKDTIAAFEKMGHCQDISEAMTIQREWMKRSMHRLDEDFSSLTSQTSDMLQEAGPAEAHAPANMSEVAHLPAGEIETHVRVVEHTRQRGRSTGDEGPNHLAKPTKSRANRRRR